MTILLDRAPDLPSVDDPTVAYIPLHDEDEAGRVAQAFRLKNQPGAVD